ncbi:ABC transporter [Rhizoctonia solani]|uniref:ABC transporter n=1 Tax=Rhizoctonia solani TaxID=456999 RepID=A0A8H8P7V9_9AGAM|nr:ABC transporter [Rhizoctonia solani]QRW26810.1 ABC transporter [Rhizoctonia solani]
MGRWYTPFAYTSGFVLNKDEVFDLAKHVAFDFAPSPTAHELEVVVFIHNASRNIRLHMGRERASYALQPPGGFPRESEEIEEDEEGEVYEEDKSEDLEDGAEKLGQKIGGLK